MLQETISGTEITVSYLDIYTKLDFDSNIWLNTPVLKWTIDAADDSVITESETFSIKIGFLADIELALKDLLPIPTEYALYQNYPNPFNPVTRINYDIPFSGKVTLIIYNLLGREVTTLVNDLQQPGRYSLIWNGHDKDNRMVSSGLYFYHLSTPEYQKTKKMMLIK